jgi:YbbR domain-containing protein
MKSPQNIVSRFTEWLGERAWPKLIISSRSDDQTPVSTREKVIVFTIAYVIAVISWLMVNLDREFNLDLEIPVTAASISPDLALVSPIPTSITVGVSGEGWKLLNLYNNPPSLPLNLEQSQINMFEQVRTLFGSSQDVNITKVQPSILNIQLDERVQRRVPIDLRMDLNIRRQYLLIGDLRMSPDSVTITGARSKVEDFTVWPTQLITLEGVREPIDMLVDLEAPTPVVSLSTMQVRVEAEIVEFTEGEIRVPVVVSGAPAGRQVTFTPSAVAVRYSVPIEEYAQSQNEIPFRVYIPYSQIAQDTTGLVSPVIEITSNLLNIRVRSSQPRSVSYFVIISDN